LYAHSTDPTVQIRYFISELEIQLTQVSSLAEYHIGNKELDQLRLYLFKEDTNYLFYKIEKGDEGEKIQMSQINFASNFIIYIYSILEMVDSSPPQLASKIFGSKELGILVLNTEEFFSSIDRFFEKNWSYTDNYIRTATVYVRVTQAAWSILISLIFLGEFFL
jgi:hypothetical protein